jgi:aldose sugar dehydrogenase
MLRILTFSFITMAAGIAGVSFMGNKLPVTEIPVKSTGDSVEINFKNFCSGCHGEKMEAFVDRKWKYGSNRNDLFKSIKHGYPDNGMPAYDSAFNDQEIFALADYILTGIKNRERYDFDNSIKKENLFISENQNVKLDTIFSGIESCWSFAFLPGNEMLVTEKAGRLLLVKKDRTTQVITGTPPVSAEGQGGMLDVILHPEYKKNKTIYLSYSAIKKEGNLSLSTTAIMKATLDNGKLTNQQIIFEALPWSKTKHHYGSRMLFAKDGLLYFTVGERGNEKENPQSLNNGLGKVHRIKDDGTIPADNPFVNTPGATASIYTYGNRNPQGLAADPSTGLVWSHEHGPRGGDEINIIGAGKNFGWPAITYGINYNGKIMSDKTAMPGMEQPLLYWIPSIAPSGMAFVQGNRYKGWKGNLLAGSLRFKYLNRCVIENGKIVKEELLLKNIGRLRDVRMGPDGFIYVAVENPGYIFKLIPVEK